MHPRCNVASVLRERRPRAEASDDAASNAGISGHPYSVQRLPDHVRLGRAQGARDVPDPHGLLPGDEDLRALHAAVVCIRRSALAAPPPVLGAEAVAVATAFGPTAARIAFVGVMAAGGS